MTAIIPSRQFMLAAASVLGLSLPAIGAPSGEPASGEQQTLTERSENASAHSDSGMEARPSTPTAGTARAASDALPAQARASEDEGNVVLPVQNQGGLTFINGGIGDRERSIMESMRREFSAHLVFSESRDRVFVSAVHVDVLDASGKRVFSLDDAGPMLWVNLPNGHYTVRATLEGRTLERRIAIAHGRTIASYFNWKDAGADRG